MTAITNCIDFFVCGTDNEFDIHYVKYGLYISEDMFSE